MALTSEQKVGIFSLVAMLILGVVTFQITHISDAMKSWVHATVLFSSASGLEEGGLVLLAGVRAGKVERIAVENGRVAVHLRIEQRFADDIREDSIFSLERDNLLGQWRVVISLGSRSRKPMDLSRPIQGTDAPDLMSAMQRILNKVERGEGTLGKLVCDETLFDDLASAAKALSQMLGQNAPEVHRMVMEVSERLPVILADLQDITRRAKEGRGVVGKLLTDDKLAGDLERAIKSLSEITQKIERGEGALGRLLVDSELYDDLRQTAASAKRIARRLEEGKGALGRLLKDEKLAQDISKLAASAQRIAGRLEAGKGFMGKLLTDEELYARIKHIVAKMEEAVESYKEQVPISAFGSIVFSAF